MLGLTKFSWAIKMNILGSYYATCCPFVPHLWCNAYNTCLGCGRPWVYAGLYWYFQHSQCLNLRKTYSTQHTYISMGPYARAPWAKFCPACPCVKTALNTHLSYIPPMLMLKIYRPRWTQCDDNILDPLVLVMVR